MITCLAIIYIIGNILGYQNGLLENVFYPLGVYWVRPFSIDSLKSRFFGFLLLPYSSKPFAKWRDDDENL